MGSEECWECEEEFSRDKVLDIPVFKSGWTVKWCFNCVMKQLEWSDYRLIPKPGKYKRFKIKSFEDNSKEWRIIVDELILCYESQFRKLKEIDYTWGELHTIANDIQENEEDIIYNKARENALKK